MSMTRALRLIGASVIVTGVGPSMAIVLVARESELKGLTTRTTLEDGVVDAVARVGAPSSSLRLS